MPEISPGVRAKSGYIEVKRKRKDGKVVKTRQHQVASQGMFSAKEMEKVMQDVAKDAGVSEDQIRIETYQHGKAPIEANPRHRGIPASTYQNGERKRMYGGWSIERDGPGSSPN